MAGQISLQPQKCEECEQQEMRWEISVAEIAQGQNINKDIDSKTFDTIVGKRSSTTEETDTEERKKSEDETKAFNLCSDPTCRGHTETLATLVRWKLRNVSPDEYSNEEVNEIVTQTVEQSVHDYQTVTETVAELTESDTQKTEDEESITDEETAPKKETPPQQLDRCECGERQNPTQTSIGTAITEEEAVKDSNRFGKSFKVAVSALPFVEVDVGGGTEDGTETTTKETERIKTMDTATFPICSDLTCEEHLLMRGQIECWKMRNDSSREYTNEEIDETVSEELEQEITDGKILSENADEVFEDLLGESQDQDQTASMASSTNTQMSAFFRAFDAETAPSIGLDGSNTSEQTTTEANATPSTGAIADRLIEARPSADEGTGTSNSEGMNSDDNDEKKGPGGNSL